jgi:hypothetical protein
LSILAQLTSHLDLIMDIEPYSYEALLATAVGWLTGAAIDYFLFLVIWPWEGGLKMGRRATRGVFLDRKLVPEKLMLLGWLQFCVVILIGTLITQQTNIDLDNSLLVKVYGFNNICVNFDFAPSNFCLPFLWVIACFTFVMYCLVDLIVVEQELFQGHISRRSATWISRLLIFTGLCFMLFTTIFAVSPENEEVDPHHYTLILHTIPFLIMQWGLFTWNLAMFVKYTTLDLWTQLGLPRYLKTYGVVHLTVVVIVTCFKNVWAMNALLGKPWFNDESHPIAIVDRFWLALMVVFPIVALTCLIAFKYDHLLKCCHGVESDDCGDLTVARSGMICKSKRNGGTVFENWKRTRGLTPKCSTESATVGSICPESRGAPTDADPRPTDVASI